MKKILLPLALLVLVGMDIMAMGAIQSSNDGFVLFGWVAILTSTVIYAVFALQFLSKNSKK